MGKAFSDWEAAAKRFRAEAERLEAQYVSDGKHIAAAEAEIERLQKGIEYFGRELDRLQEQSDNYRSCWLAAQTVIAELRKEK